MSHYGQITASVTEVKKSLKSLVEIKEKLVSCNFKNEELVEEALMLKQRCLFLFSRITSIARDLHFEVHQKEKALKEPQGRLLQAVDSLENVAYEKTQLVRKTEGNLFQK